MSVKGYTEPRIYTPPLRELTPDTSLGFMCIEYAKTVLREQLYPWQEWLFIHVLEIVGDMHGIWRFRFRIILIMVARQNGKTKVSKILASFFLNVLRVPNIFGTSLSLDKAEEVWEDVVYDQENIPQLKKEWVKSHRTNGSKRLELTERRIYKVGAPTQRAGRGDSNDLVMLDEVREQHDWKTWSATVNSTNAKPNGILLGFTNAGDPQSIVLRQVRSTAIEKITGEKAFDFGGDVDGDLLAIFEWSAPDEASINDWDAIAQANPSLGYGLLTERALIAARDTMTEQDFRAECLCQQVETLLPQPFPEGAWQNCLDVESSIAPESDLYFGIDMSQDRRWVSIGVCGMREDGNYHIEVAARRVGSEWAVDWFRERAFKNNMKLAFQGRGAPVCGLAEQICTLDGVTRCAVEGADLTTGWGRFWDSIAASAPVKDGEEARGGVKTFHLTQPILDTPAKTCQLRNIGGGVELPDRTKSPDDISPLMACAMAFAAATRVTQGDKKVYQSSYASGSTLMFV